MWVSFGIAAIITAILNVIWTIQHREAKWFRYISMSCTALTLCAFLSKANGWILSEDWSALADVIPDVSKAMWFLTISSVVINSISLFWEKKSTQIKH